MKEIFEEEDISMAKKELQEEYMKKLQDIKVRVPKEQYTIIKDYADSKGMSINKLIVSLLEKEIGDGLFPTIREQNKAKKEQDKK